MATDFEAPKTRIITARLVIPDQESKPTRASAIDFAPGIWSSEMLRLAKGGVGCQPFCLRPPGRILFEELCAA